MRTNHYSELSGCKVTFGQGVKPDSIGFHGVTSSPVLCLYPVRQMASSKLYFISMGGKCMKLDFKILEHNMEVYYYTHSHNQDSKSSL